MSVQIVREKNQTDAIKIKNQSFINEQIVAERKQKEV